MADFVKEEADFTGIFPSMYFNFKYSPEETAEILGKIKIYLSEKEKPNINARNFTGATLLHKACQFDSLDSVKFLVENGADVNIQNLDGNMPISLCKRSKNPNEIIVFLVEKCNPNVYTKNNIGGRSFYDFAVKYEVEWLVKLIEEHSINIKPAKRD
jgi:ankyrin repeat protein